MRKKYLKKQIIEKNRRLWMKSNSKQIIENRSAHKFKDTGRDSEGNETVIQNIRFGMQRTLKKHDDILIATQLNGK